MHIMEGEGKVILKKVGSLYCSTVVDEKKFAEDILDIEQYLNVEVTPIIYQKYGVGVRFHL